MPIFMLLLIFQGDTLHKIPVGEPVKYQDEANPKTYLSGIRQLESNGKNLVILRKDSPSALEITPEGDFVRNIGHRGDGPGELGLHGPIAMAVKAESTWIFRSDMKALNYYEKGKYITGFKPESYQLGPNTTPSFSFAFDSTHIVIQSHPSRRRLANAYDYGGELATGVGEILPVEREFLRVNPALNNTAWLKDDESWWCLFLFRPILREFDSKFQLKREITLNGPEIEEKEEKYFKNEVDPSWRPYPKWHFSDFKIFKNSIFVMCEGTLYQINKKTGKTESRSIFTPNKKILQVFHIPKVNFQFFAFTENGRLFLGNTALSYEQDGIWEATFPFPPSDR